eukprot:NODE_161_length_16629_cov_0.427344.p2 type:complete len:451 gc:universal NODE_161_length_16629_cov_0.427344:5043-3691(-)
MSDYAESNTSEGDRINPQLKLSARKTNHLYFYTEPALNCLLIPISISADCEGIKFREQFLWNAFENLYTPKYLLEVTMSDYNCSMPVLSNACLSQFVQQISDPTDHPLMNVQESEEDRFIPIIIDLNHSSLHIRDEFYWDLESTVSVEDFTYIYCTELGLGTTWECLVAFTIYDQIYYSLQQDEIVNHIPQQNIKFPSFHYLDDSQIQKRLTKTSRRRRRKYDYYQPSYMAKNWKLDPNHTLEKPPNSYYDEIKVDKETLDLLNQADSMVVESKAPKYHRGFGASARVFNIDGTKQVSEFRKSWKCNWCLLSGLFTPTMRKGPHGPRTLCNVLVYLFRRVGYSGQRETLYQKKDITKTNSKFYALGTLLCSHWANPLILAYSSCKDMFLTCFADLLIFGFSTGSSDCIHSFLLSSMGWGSECTISFLNLIWFMLAIEYAAKRIDPRNPPN